MPNYVCDYSHYDDRGSEMTRPAEVWTQDYQGKWTPLCGACLPEFWVGGDREGGPWVVYPIHVDPPGPKRLKDHSSTRCYVHNVKLIDEPGGPDMPTIHGRRYCPACQGALNKALDT